MNNTVLCTYPHNYNFWCSSFLCVIYISNWHHFLLPENAADELLVYEKNLYFLHLKNIFVRYGILC